MLRLGNDKIYLYGLATQSTPIQNGMWQSKRDMSRKLDGKHPWNHDNVCNVWSWSSTSWRSDVTQNKSSAWPASSETHDAAQHRSPQSWTGTATKITPRDSIFYDAPPGIDRWPQVLRKDDHRCYPNTKVVERRGEFRPKFYCDLCGKAYHWQGDQVSYWGGYVNKTWNLETIPPEILL